MAWLLGIPLAVRLVLLFVIGVLAAGPINWAADAWAWNHRWRSPWRRAPAGHGPRSWLDCLPLVGWWRLRREEATHGVGFWLRPLLVELTCGAALATLYYWETETAGLIAGQINPRVAGGIAMINVSTLAAYLHAGFLFHAVLGALMMIASLIDIDDRIIPDQVTVPGTILGLLLATLLPIGLLPQVNRTITPTVVAKPLLTRAGPAAQEFGVPLWLEPVHVCSSNPWPENRIGAQRPTGLALGLACWWLWCFAFTRRRWRGSRGLIAALKIIAARVVSDFGLRPLREIAVLGTMFVTAVWWWGDGGAWFGLCTALVGLVGCGGAVWLIRILGSAAMGREAMGFGDVTLMMMIGTFLGWQAGVLIFFFAPFAGLLLGVVQLLLRRGDALPYGPFLCLGTVFVVVNWAALWDKTEIFFAAGWLVPIVLLACLIACGLMLAVWTAIKRRLIAADGH